MLSPAVEAVGRLTRGRPHLQGTLAVAGLVSSVGALMVWRATAHHDPALALLQQDYVRNLAAVLGLVVLIGACTAIASRLKQRG